MERIELIPDGPRLSRLVYGAWRLEEDPAGSAPERVLAKIDRCLELGITSFDHADIYGGYRCEQRFGAALAERPGLRDSIELVTKCDICPMSEARPAHRVTHYDASPGHIQSSVETSLHNLGTDRVDVLLLHRPDPLMDADETAAALTGLVDSGKVLHLGVSNFTPSQFELLQSRLERPLVTNQIELSVLHLEPLVDGSLDHCQRLRCRPMAWSPMAGGRLFAGDDGQATRARAKLVEIAERMGASADQVALAWVLALPSQPLPILGTNRLERITSAAGALQLELDRQSWYEIYEAAMGRPVP